LISSIIDGKSIQKDYTKPGEKEDDATSNFKSRKLNLIHGIFHLEDPQIIGISSRMRKNNTNPSEIEDDTTSTFNYRKEKLVHCVFH
jgi:hypothetical protein